MISINLVSNRFLRELRPVDRFHGTLFRLLLRRQAPGNDFYNEFS